MGAKKYKVTVTSWDGEETVFKDIDEVCTGDGYMVLRRENSTTTVSFVNILFIETEPDDDNDA